VRLSITVVVMMLVIFCTELVDSLSSNLFFVLNNLRQCLCRYWNQVLLEEGVVKGDHPCFTSWFDLDGEKYIFSNYQLASWSLLHLRTYHCTSRKRGHKRLQERLGSES
jgi:hypothetical protein